MSTIASATGPGFADGGNRPSPTPSWMVVALIASGEVVALIASGEVVALIASGEVVTLIASGEVVRWFGQSSRLDHIVANVPAQR